MPDLSPTIDGELENAVVNFSGIDLEVVAEHEPASIALNNSATAMGIQWVNTSGIAVQPSQAVFEFDTSGISAAPESATLKVYIESENNGGVDFYVVRVFLNTGGAIALADNNSWTKASSGGSADINNITKYSDKVDYSEDMTVEETNNITLNSTALSDMASKDRFQFSLMNYFLVDQTVGGETSGTTRTFAISSQDHSTSSRRPVLSYTMPTGRTIGNLNIMGGTHTIIGSKIVIK